MLLSIVQYLYGFSELFPQNKNCKSDIFQSICINLFCLKNNTHVNELVNAIDGKSFQLIYKQVFLSEINNNNESNIICTILDAIQQEEIWKNWFSNFSNHFKSNLEYKIKYILDDFTKAETQKRLLEKYNLNINNLNIIYNGLSNFDFTFFKEDNLYYCAGDFLGFDELDFLEINTVKKDVFYAHLLSKLIHIRTDDYLKNIPQNKLEECIENINSILPFKKCWNINKNYDFMCLYISFYYVIEELKQLYPQSVENFIKILQSKGIIFLDKLFDNGYNPIKIFNQVNNVGIKKLFESKLPQKDEINAILLKYTEYYTIESDLTFKKQLSQISKDNFFIFIGEFHKCDEHNHFLAKCINEFYLLGFENIFWEKSKDYQTEINDYIFNKTDILPEFIMLREREFIERVREINLKNNNKLHIYCYDLSSDDFDSLDFNFSERERKCYLEIKKNINNKKSIFLSGRFLTYQNNRPVNWDINVTSSFIEPYDITALIYKKKDVISFVNFSHNHHTNKKYIGYTEFGNIGFDNNISTLSSGGFSIHKLGEEFDGMLVYPNVDWMNGEK